MKGSLEQGGGRRLTRTWWLQSPEQAGPREHAVDAASEVQSGIEVWERRLSFSIWTFARPARYKW